MVKNPPASLGDLREAGSSLSREDPLEEGIATHSSTLAWRVPWTEEPHGLRSIGLQRVGHNCSDLAHMAMGFSPRVWAPLSSENVPGPSPGS